MMLFFFFSKPIIIFFMNKILSFENQSVLSVLNVTFVLAYCTINAYKEI